MLFRLIKMSRRVIYPVFTKEDGFQCLIHVLMARNVNQKSHLVIYFSTIFPGRCLQLTEMLCSLFVPKCLTSFLCVSVQRIAEWSEEIAGFRQDFLKR